LISGEHYNQPVKPRILFFELPEPPQLAHAEMGILLPGVEGCSAIPYRLHRSPIGVPTSALAERIDDLLFR
jgi:hypothetical protein